MGVDGTYQEIVRSDEVVPTLLRGGAVNFWKGEATVQVFARTYDKASGCGLEELAPGWSSVGLNVDDVEFRSDVPSRASVADDAESLLVWSIRELRAVYALAAIEEQQEAVWDQLKMTFSCLSGRRLPPVLWCFNYWGRAHFARMEEVADECRGLGCLLRDEEAGVSAKLAKYPWELGIDQFLRLNEVWRSRPRMDGWRR
jgi:hypothetical protein